MAYILVALCVISLAAGQLLFKTVSGKMSNLSSLLLTYDTAKFFFAAMALYGVSTLLWISALRTLPLSKAYPFMAIGFIIVPIAAHLIFGERLTYLYFIGATIIVCGIIIISIA